MNQILIAGISIVNPNLQELSKLLQIPPRNHQKGVSLVEVLIAMAVFSVGILGLMPMFFYTSNQMRMQKDKEDVQQLLVDWMGFMQSMDYADLTQAGVDAATNTRFSPQTGDKSGFGNSTASEGPIEFNAISQLGQSYRVRFDLDDGDNSDSLESSDDPLERGFKRVTVQIWWRNIGPKEYGMSLSRLFLMDAEYIEGV